MTKRTLILGNDYQPVSMLPLSAIPWQHSIKLFFLEKITVLEWYDDVVRSTSLSMQIPAVAVSGGINHRRAIQFNRMNLYIRDLFQCQYCGKTFDYDDLTIDHVMPRCRGGKHNWENTVSACKPCNSRKGDKIMKPLREPHRPDYWKLSNNKRSLIITELDHPSWSQYL